MNLESLAKRLDVTVEHLWGALLRQAPINGAFDLLFCILTACALYGTYRLWKWTLRKAKEHAWGDEK